MVLLYSGRRLGADNIELALGTLRTVSEILEDKM